MPRLPRLGLFCLSLFTLPAHAQDLNIGSELVHGGVAIFLIGALSVLSVAVTLERLVNFRLRKVAPPDLAEEAENLWRTGRFDQLRARVGDGDSSLARILGWMVEQRHLPPEKLAARVAEMAGVELRLQQHKAYALNVVATVAPIVGLLGTVVGMIESFHVIAFNGMGDPTLLAGGISKALVNTAAGLSVALPSLAMHHVFRNRMVGIGIALERQLNRVLDGMPARTLEVVHAH
ncbi:MotA/TolQ/ExbB proton channel family protein [Massilia pinisoli]|uniref:MotA/TolQ/ExbB proton channel family protein n=1 Tax=Massilia pinisoli TaxID=1772194 RepID=A0ABT1ZQW8_9BURK|nr:MotA/TolQ/ExbB proton channel family protein [Massilia pinisoli]MCS0582310.1 MotA/TolQ/ExbB proton channel family protein [Massilia pinisoli]